VSKAPTKVPIPGRTDCQRRQALERANEIRTARSHLKKQLCRGEVSLGLLLANYPSYLANAKVGELVRALPGYGPVKTRGLLAGCRISPAKTMVGLSPRQRLRLLEALKK
jgi:hypothetical protein